MKTESHPKCTGSGGGCPPPATVVLPAPASGFARRDFLRLVGASATATLAFRPWQFAMAGPFTHADFEMLVPADKKLSPEWVKSLTARGEREVYRGADLAKIGMPVGGICAGQVYLGGDGRLWHWDIFNRHVGTGAEHYAKPMKASSPLEQGFVLRVTADGKSEERSLDAVGWKDVSFIGEYPIGYVTYADAGCPVTVNLEAFSPFIPMDVDDSSLPASVIRFTVRNTGTQRVEAELAGWLENAVCLHSGQQRAVLRRNRIVRRGGYVALECSAEAPPESPSAPRRPDILFDDFEREAYGGWTAAGTAFGQGPVAQTQVPDYQGNLGMHGQRAVNTHASAPASDVGARDAHTGTLMSKPFTIERNYITFFVGGGNHKGKTCVNLLVEGKAVLSTTGKNDNHMTPATWDVRKWLGQSAKIQIVDNETGAWGNIGFDDIVFSDQPATPPGPLAQEADFGTMGIALLKSATRNDLDTDRGVAALSEGEPLKTVFSPGVDNGAATTRPSGQKLIGSLTRKLSLAPGASGEVVFVITWHFSNLTIQGVRPSDQARVRNLQGNGRYYASKFASANEVAGYVAANFDRLADQTRLWHDTWYDSTLPYWFLDRTFLNTSILASSTCFRFADGRFWAWEGVGCCAGTCGHVWQYAHAMGRVFPELERLVRERTDFGLAQQADGAIRFRGENNNIPAIDAQAGTILRALREHQMTPDDAWLKKLWPQIKSATQWLLAKDANGDGLIEGNQHNTLDTDWFGPVAWLSGLYLAALLAAAEMADVTGDTEFAAKCRSIVEAGRKNLVSQLFVDDYFINKVDPKHLDAINSGTGCEIDQVMGQSWAFQLALPRVLPEKETRAALASLWRHNFTPDVGPYRDAYKAGRWYAMPGEAGLLMCSFPRTDWDYAQAKGKGPEWAAGYFNECMNGFEYQVAGHMLWEGMVTEGLAITRAVHDRYHPSRRNPFNEIECGDHYARSMASYGVFLAACGYEYDGPKAALAFAPRLTPENFKCAFTTAEGWGSYTQKRDGGKLNAAIVLRYGRLRLTKLTIGEMNGKVPTRVEVTLVGKLVPAQLLVNGGRATVFLVGGIVLEAGQDLAVTLG